MSDLSDLIRNIKATHGLTPAYEMHGLLYQCLGAFETLQRECDAWQDKYSAQLAKRLRAYARIEVLQRENEALKHDLARHVASEEATRADKAVSLLTELAAVKRYDPNGSRGWARNYLTLNIPATLLERVDAALQVKGKS